MQTENEVTGMNVKKCFVILGMVWFLFGIASAEASGIHAKDCAIGGVQAGWHSQHHYLPEDFNDTALKDAQWITASTGLRLDVFPKSYVIGRSQTCTRTAEDMSISLSGIYIPQSREAGNVVQSIFKKDWIYVAAISVWNVANVDTSYKLLARDLKTPRGIHIGSTLDEVRAAYGMEDDAVEDGHGGTEYLYVTSETLATLYKNPNYMGVGMSFLVDNETGLVDVITVFNSKGF